MPPSFLRTAARIWCRWSIDVISARPAASTCSQKDSKNDPTSFSYDESGSVGLYWNATSESFVLCRIYVRSVRRGAKIPFRSSEVVIGSRSGSGIGGDPGGITGAGGRWLGGAVVGGGGG
jgi:hypothetical protein